MDFCKRPSFFLFTMIGCLNISDKAKNIIDFSSIAFDTGEYFHPIGNFSIIPYKGNYLASFRRFAYHITSGEEKYVTCQALKLTDPHKQLFCVLDKSFNLVKQLQCASSTYWLGYEPNTQKRLPYLEDMRMVEWNGSIYGMSTIFYQGETGYSTIGLEVQKIGIEDDVATCEHFWNSIPSGIKGTQKNFLPIPDKPFHYIAATFPEGATVYDLTNNRFTNIGKIENDKLLRGNAPLLKTDFGYMTITHILDFDELKRKRYNNFIVFYDNDLNVVKVSRPFKLSERNIEFITTFMEDGDDLLIGNTVMDELPLLFRFDRNELLGALEMRK